MFNNSEWATKEEWDAYAWFGFAIQEAQYLEQMLLVMAVSINMNNRESGTYEENWFSLYDQFGRLTLGQLLHHIRQYVNFPQNLADDLKKVVRTRNYLAHSFFWSKDLNNDEKTPEAAQKELMAAASLFANIAPSIEPIMYSLFDKIQIKREDAEREASSLMSNQI